MRFVIPLITILLGAEAFVLRDPTPAAGGPCYAVMTIVAADTTPYHIRRVVTSGIQRFDDTGSGTPSGCTPADDSRLRAVQRIVEDHLAGSARLSLVDRILIKSTSPEIAASHLTTIMRRTHEFADAARVEVVMIPSVETIAAPALPELLPAAERAKCLEDNITLAATAAAFRWAC